ncbi:MAG: hypothetical protein AAGJ85_09100 [Pseudomonadota bacterium]
MKVLFSIIVGLFLSATGIAESKDERASLVLVLEQVTDQLPEEKQDRAFTIISEFKSGEALSDYTYGLVRAQPLLEAGGVDRLIAEARKPKGQLRYAKLDALLAVGVQNIKVVPADAARLNAVLLDLARSADDFEQAMYAHAAAELAALRCDMATFEAALDYVGDKESLRYQFWAARISGDGGSVIAAIDMERERNDTRVIRQAIDGYRLISEFGYCAPYD